MTVDQVHPEARAATDSRYQGGSNDKVPIAIIGISAKLPGTATDPEKLFAMCAEKQDAWSSIPTSRFNHEAFYYPDTNRPGTINVKGANFLQVKLPPKELYTILMSIRKICLISTPHSLP
jgi:hypothetical protein